MKRDQKQIGDKICDLRISVGWSTLDLARAANMREQFLAQIEAGEVAKVNILTYRKIADSLNVSVEHLLGMEELPDGARVENEINPRYLWLFSFILRLTMLLGFLCLLLLASLLAGWLLVQLQVL